MTASTTEVTEPQFRNQRSIEIAAPPDRVWPWLAQMGFGRAGWYSWDLIDNLGRRSATELHPEWMVRQAGDPVPGGPIEFDTPILEAPNHLVIAVSPARRGLWTIEFVLSYRLRPTATGTQLTAVATGRIDGPLGRLVARWLLGPGDAFMVRRQLRGIKSRSERTGSTGEHTSNRCLIWRRSTGTSRLSSCSQRGWLGLVTRDGGPRWWCCTRWPPGSWSA